MPLIPVFGVALAVLAVISTHLSSALRTRVTGWGSAASLQPYDDVLRSSGQYGPKVEVPDDADVQTKLIAFIGRDPR